MQTVEANPQERKGVGNITSMMFDIKGLMEMKEKMTYNQLTLLVGQNGTGKTFMMVMVWCMSLIANIYAMIKNAAMCTPVLQFILDNSFTDQNFTGSVEAEFKNMSLKFELEDGQVKNLNITAPEDIQHDGSPTFMSKNTRTYCDIVKYLQMKDIMGIKGGINISSEEDVKKLSKVYRLYDILFIEQLIMKLEKPMVLRDSVRNSISETLKKDIVSISYDPNKIEFYYQNGEGEQKSLTTMSAGEQSWINMTTSAGS